MLMDLAEWFTVVDPGFIEGGFWYTLACEIFRGHTHFLSETTPISIIFETNYEAYQSNLSIFEQIFF